MTRKLTTIILTVTTVLTFSLGTALGTNGIKNGWLGDYPDICPDLADAANDCTLCHGDAFALNDYALDYLDNGEDWLAIDGMDSDGDTVNNGQEINVDCTLPGDASSVTPNDNHTWGSIKALYD